MKSTANLRLLTVAAWCALALAPVTLRAAEPRPHQERGTIKSVDAATHTLVLADLKNSKEYKFQWNDQTKFTERGKTVTAAELKAGERIRVSYQGTGDMPTIERARLVPAKAGKAASASHHRSRNHSHAHV